MGGQAKTLSELGLTALQGREVAITGLAVDSREVKAGYLFAALPGTKVHGATFIQYALRMGATAVLTDIAGARIAEEVLAASDAAVVLIMTPGDHRKNLVWDDGVLHAAGRANRAIDANGYVAPKNFVDRSQR